MTLLQPLGLLALLAVPAIVVLHLFRRQLRQRRAAGLFLFAADRLIADAGRTRTRLLHTPSLWLECLAATLLALWLAGPSFGGARARHLVFVLDDSASMQAGAQARAAAAVRQQVSALGGGGVVTLLRTGPRPAVLAGPAARPGDALAALAGWRPVQRRHDPGPALDLARELAGDDGEITFCTDGEPVVPPADCDVLAFGAALPNAAILTAQRLPRAGGEELHLRFGGFGRLDAVAFTVSSGEQALLTRELPLPDGFADAVVALPPGTRTVRVDLRADALPIDDTAWLLPLPERVVAVCDLLPAELRRQLALDRVLAAIPGVRHEVDAPRAQLLLTDRPGALRPGQCEVVLAPGAPDGERDAWRGPFVIDRTHPWLLGVQLQGVVWLAGRRELPGNVLVAAGAQALLSEEVLDAGRRLWLDLDARAGNLVRAPDWPVLWANVVERARLEVAGAEANEVLLGEEARYRRALLAGGPDTEITFVAPDGTRVAAAPGRVVGFVPTTPGLHRVLGRDGTELAQIAARFCDPAESDLRDLTTGSWPRTAPLRRAGAAVRDDGSERRWLALVVLLCLAADWWWLHRRSP
ncbi:MAG: BatA domain-containing protein [Planctomycetes bacterium]|nr:BatA domain-containing protein [Planctomycetota bacterium]